MLQNEKNDLLYLLNILESIGKIWQYSEKAKNAESFYKLNDQLNLNASLNLLANIGENVAKVSDKLKKEYPQIEWQDIKDFRNKIIHDYVGIDIVVAFAVIKDDLKILKSNVERIIKSKIKTKIFNIEELRLSENSVYYKHVDFDKII